jgi:hypothetical protein
MARVFVGFVICVVVGAIVSVSGLGRMLPPERAFVPPPVPETWAALPSGGRVEVTLVSSEGLVRGLSDGLSRSMVALRRTGAVALVDGRIFAISSASVRHVLEALSWDRLPIEARQATAAELDRFAAPAPASLAWHARLLAYVGLRSGRDLLASHPSFSAASLAAAALLFLHAFATGSTGRRRREVEQPAPSASRRRRAETPVRVVLVSDVETLAQVRTAIGEENIVASTEYAFAFADGWILAVREGSVFELVSELGWRMRPIEMSTRPELLAEGHAVSPIPSDGDGETLDLLEALHVCGPLAHA